MALNRLEKKLEKDMKVALTRRGWTLRSVEGKSGEVNGSPDVIAISPGGMNFMFELKTMSKLSPGQVLLLKKSRFAFLVTHSASSSGADYNFKYLTESGKMTNWTINELEEM